MDAPVTTAPSPLARRQRRQTWLAGATVAVLVVAVLTAAWWWLYASHYQNTDDAYVAGDLISVMSQVSGTVVAIDADETDQVRAGQELVRLDATDAGIALQDAEQQLARTVRQTRTVFANELGHARDALNAARDALIAAQKNLAASAALVGHTGIADNPDVQAAATVVERAWLALQRTRVRAPVTGYIARRGVQLGERIAPGGPLMAIVPLERLRVDANFREVQLKHMRIGQPVTVVTDLYGGQVKYHGTVAGLGLGTGAAFALLPAQNATGNWIKVVQRVPVRIALEGRELAAHPLRIGLSTNASVDIHDDSGPQLAPAPRQEPVLTTSAYDIDRREITARIAQIIGENSLEAAVTQSSLR